MLRRRALLAATLLVCALPPAAAQLPSNQVCSGDNFTLTHAAPDAVPPGGTATVTVAVQNKGSLDATVNLSASVTTPGWKLTSSDSQGQVVTAGSKASFVFSMSPDATAKDAGALNVAGSATCGPGGLPVGCPAGACTVQLKADTASVAVQAPQSLLPFPINFPLEYLLAGLVLIIVLVAIPLTLRRRRAPARGGAPGLDCSEPLKPVRAGRGASFPIQVRNASPQNVKYELAVGPVPQGWSAFLPLPDVQLAPREARGLWLMVRSPPDAQNGDAAEVEVSASDPATGATTNLRVRAEVMSGATDAA
jgi:hypothetical protein